jgi:hypothetical protein
LDSGRWYRWSLGLVTVIVLMIITDLASAAEFSAETIIDQLKQKQKVKMYVKGQQLRVEMVDSFGQKQILISHPGQSKTFILYPETKTYVPLPAAAVRSPIGQDEEALKKIGSRRLIGQENIEGYLCDKYMITFHNKYLGKIIVWIARKLNYPIQVIQVDGPPVGSLSRKLTNIEEHRVKDSLFDLPTDYREVKKPQGDCRAGMCRVSYF